MKRIKHFLFSIVLIFISSAISCNIEPYGDDESEQVNLEAGTFQVDFDGQTFKADNTVATVLNDVINISGIKTNTGEAIILTVFGNSIGTYKLGVTQNQVELNSASLAENGNVWPSVTDFVTSQGEIIITELDEENKTITGTFFFTGHNPITMSSKVFENGSFTKIPYEASLGTNNGNNTFFAKVDGDEFVEDSIGGALLTLPGTPSTITITAAKNSLQTISISVNANITSGDYTFSTFDSPIGQYNVSLTEGTVSDDGGELIITEHDVVNKKIVGTFKFTAKPLFGSGKSYEITEGSFSVTYL